MNNKNNTLPTKNINKIKKTQEIIIKREAMEIGASIVEPFTGGRETPRLLFDFSIMLSLLRPNSSDFPVLDFGAGTGWISEFCVRMGFQTVAFDIHKDLLTCLKERAMADYRINEKLLSFAQGDGHNMPFETETFGHLLCYDTLHHMHDYQKVFAEFFRVLKLGGRAIFVEPGSRHSSSPETIEFIKSQKLKNPNWDWIERDVVLEEINQIAHASGFKNGISIVPTTNPFVHQVYSMEEWSLFRSGDMLQQLRIIDQMSHINYCDRVIFYVDKF